MTKLHRHSILHLLKVILTFELITLSQPMNRFALAFIILLLTTKTVFSQQDTVISQPVFCPQGSWELVFAEEFTSEVLDKEQWLTYFPYTDDGSDQCAFCRTHGNEGQVFKDENIEISNGILKIIAKRESAAWFDQQRDFTSGMIHSRQAFAQGRYEIRSKLPAGMGFWPGLWTFGQISAEIDIMEAGMQNPERFHTSIHNWKIGKMAHNKNRVKMDLSEDFHVYAMEWDTNIIRFFIDDTEVWSFSRFTNRRGRNRGNCNLKPGRYKIDPVFPPEQERLFLIIGLGVGNDSTPFTKSPGPETVLPNMLEVDWIRYYQRK